MTTSQATFLTETLNPLLTEAQAGRGVVYFGDGAHFVLSSELGYVWSRERRFVRAASGRHHTNFAEFKSEIDACLNKLDSQHKSSLATLLTLKFQTFEKCCTLPT